METHQVLPCLSHWGRCVVLVLAAQSTQSVSTLMVLPSLQRRGARFYTSCLSAEGAAGGMDDPLL